MTDFEALYQSNPDPWDIHESWYERRKQEILLACLPRHSYGQALELGCGTGELTARLAQRCDCVLAIDLSPTAIDHCRTALAQAQISNVQTFVMRVPDAWPADVQGRFDLIVVSELAYYLADDAVEPLLDCCRRSLAAKGDWVMCHYLPDFHDRRQDTLTLHHHLSEACHAAHVISHRDEQFVLDIWRIKERGAP